MMIHSNNNQYVYQYMQRDGIHPFGTAAFMRWLAAAHKDRD